MERIEEEFNISRQGLRSVSKNSFRICNACIETGGQHFDTLLEIKRKLKDCGGYRILMQQSAATAAATMEKNKDTFCRMST
jgi:hypothetical protein